MLLFRDPVRVATAPAEVACAPVDGRVVAVEGRNGLDEAGGAWRIRITTSLWDVHVVRAPLAGTLAPAAPADGASHQVTAPRGGAVAVQLKPTMGRMLAPAEPLRGAVERGQAVAVLPLGGSCSLSVPESARLVVQAGDRVRAGHSPVAILGSMEAE